jgi:O-antigen biosynthesis protein
MHYSTPPPNFYQLLADLEIGDELFWDPIRLVRPGAWSGHVATAFWLTKVLRPHIFVELGTHSGNSYSAFCQAISALGLPARAFAVDTWQGDEHAGFYDESVFSDLHDFNQKQFPGFSKLIRTTFDEARQYFPENGIDLLHIDGLHTYDAVKHDFEHWKGALSSNAVVVMHDTNVRERGFGVWQLWQELSALYPSFEFYNSEGLGILGVGPNQSPTLCRLFEIGKDPERSAVVRRLFAARGEVFSGRSRLLDLQRESMELAGTLRIGSERVSVLEQDARSAAELMAQLKSALSARDAALAAKDQEIQNKDSLIGSLRDDLAARDTSITNQSAEIERMGSVILQHERKLVSDEKMLGARLAEIGELSRSSTQLREQVAATNKVLQQERSSSSKRIDLLQQQLADVRQRLGEIESSSSWKIASRVRSSFHSFPRLRSILRRVARILWWTVSFQLIGRLRARHRLFQMRDMIANSALFDADWYLSQYPDIAQSGTEPALHYALYGATERRSPGPRFDAEAYLCQHQDVADAGMNPLIHYLEHGVEEGRNIAAVGASTEAPAFPDGLPRHSYQSWVSSYDTLRDVDRTEIKRHIALLRERPVISVVMPVYDTDPAFLRCALDSVMAQLYPHWELCIADDASPNPEIRAILDDYARRDRRIKLVFRDRNGHISAASNSALKLATGTFIALMDHDDVLPEHALYMVAIAINEHPEVDVIYSDEDKIDAAGVRQTPYFKPDWNPELFYSQNYLSHLGVYRAALVRSVGGFREGYEGSQDYDLALRIIALTTADRILHIPHILYHWRTAPGVQTFSIDHLPTAVQASRRALADYFANRGEDVEVSGGQLPQFNRAVRKAPNPLPRVSLIIPTRDRLPLLRVCIDGLLNRTAYENLEVIIIDNDSCETATLEYLDSLASDERVRVLHVEGEFNYSALNNRAVEQSTGEMIGLINNDIEVIHPDWLQEMVAQLALPGVGAVGAKLYYPDNTIQHAGVILGLGGVAGHSHLRLPRTDTGYFGRLHLVHEVACVTGACLLVRKSAFLEVGGLDEQDLKIAFNDVDFCIKLRRAGYRILWTPYAELYHHESASRGYDFDPVRVERITRESQTMTERWGETLAADPFYNPNLSLVASENHKPGFPPRVFKPWHTLATDDCEMTVAAKRIN